jgi:hypothetical protein
MKKTVSPKLNSTGCTNTEQLIVNRVERCNNKFRRFFKTGCLPYSGFQEKKYMSNYIERLKEADDQLVVELSFKRVDQFFDPDDPSPIKSRDLTDDALFAMITAIIDREPKKPVDYIIRFPASQVTDEIEAGLPQAVRTYFVYRCEGAKRRLRVLLKRMKYGLIYGLSISAVLIAILVYLYSRINDQVLADIVLGAIVIFCWVALWDPIDIFLHQYLFQKKTIAICTKRIINSTIRVEKAAVQADGMPSPL